MFPLGRKLLDVFMVRPDGAREPFSAKIFPRRQYGCPPAATAGGQESRQPPRMHNTQAGSGQSGTEEFSFRGLRPQAAASRPALGAGRYPRTMASSASKRVFPCGAMPFTGDSGAQLRNVLPGAVSVPMTDPITIPSR